MALQGGCLKGEKAWRSRIGHSDIWTDEIKLEDVESSEQRGYHRSLTTQKASSRMHNGSHQARS